ncbi:MAG: monovalent cation/H(+) antiporter subunit G [Spirochaetaceae bacterium]|nr:monovalent cation/H(+) antiporter subunit G [Myxococcales bacterium]MCB9724680.1 monovalent cation/H(+) antiporter subunit G [Spirochaetaceae bacterium]
MEALREVLTWLLLVSGVGFCLIGGIGMLRMPDFYTRSHAASLTDTLGATLVVAGLAVHSGLNLISVKLVFVLVFLYLTSPTAAHALVKAAYSKGLHAPDVEDATKPRAGGAG